MAQNPQEQNLQEKASGYETLVVTRHNRACVVQLNRPDKMNAINLKMCEELLDVLAAVELDREVITLILCGNDRSFCAGADLGRMGSEPSERFETYRTRINIAPNRRLFRDLYLFTKPLICAVEGYCLGGGLEVALWGDFIIAGEKASFGLPEVARGLIPGGGGTQNLARLIGPSRAKELIWTGRRITANDALSYGIVNHLVPAGTALAKAQEIADEMSKNGPLAIMMSKQAINRGLEQSRFNGFLNEGDLAHMLQFSEDRAEGLQAFAEKRPAQFKGQ